MFCVAVLVLLDSRVLFRIVADVHDSNRNQCFMLWLFKPLTAVGDRSTTVVRLFVRSQHSHVGTLVDQILQS